AGSLTKVAGRHTIKGGGYLNHSYKAQNVGAGGIANLSFQGYVDFGNNTTNALDTGFGFANAALGVFTQYLQASKIIEGNLLYNQIESYVQDNWKVNNRLTLDYGMRFVHHSRSTTSSSTCRTSSPSSGRRAMRRCSTWRGAATARRSVRATPATRWIRAPDRSWWRRARQTRRLQSGRRFPAPAMR